MYVQDYDESWFTMFDPSNTAGTGHWYFRVSPYIKSGTGDTWTSYYNGGTNNEIRICPDGVARQFNYSMNSHISPVHWDTGLWTPETLAGFTHPTETIVFGDGGQVGEWGWTSGSGYNWYPAQIGTDANGCPVQASSDADWARFDADPQKAGGPGFQEVRYRHTLTGSIAYADGHVKAVRRGALKIWWNWTVTASDPNICQADH